MPSAGSITPALRFSSAEIYQIVTHLNYSRFIDYRIVERVLKNYEMYEGSFMMELSKGMGLRKVGKKDAAFQDLHDTGGLMSFNSF